MPTAPSDRTITKADIEAKLREIRGDVDATAAAAKTYIIAAGSSLIVATVGLAYLWGRRRGNKRTTVVEVRRL